MLIRSTALVQVGTFDDKAPVLARDIDFSIRTRMSGYRILVEPKAQVAWDGMSAVLGKRLQLELRKAAIHLRLVYSPIWTALLFWLALIPLGIARAIFRVGQKHPNLIGAELLAAAWGFFTLKSRFASRSLIPKNPKVSFSGLKNLRATWSQVRLQSRSRLDAVEAEQNLAAFSRGEQENVTGKSFTGSLGWLFAALLLVVSWQLFPSGLAVSGGGAIPLSEDLSQLFARAGASWQPIANGYAAPSDPFNWVLLLLGTLTFWAPQFSIGLLLFLARSLAFAGAWRALGLFTKKSWIKNILALAYALWPAFGAALAGARVADVVAAVTLPWLVLAVARAAGIGRVGGSRSNSQTWSWVAAAGLLLAIEGASAPNLLPVVLVGLAVVAFMRIRRFGYLFWIPLPLGAIFAPYAFYLVGKVGKPLAVFADPGIAAASKPLGNFELLFGGSLFAAFFIALSLLALLTKRWLVALSLWAFTLLLLASAWLVQRIYYPEAGSPLSLLFAAALAILVLGAIALDALQKRSVLRLASIGSLLLGVLPLGYVAVTQGMEFKQTDGRVVPWLLVSQEKSDGQVLRLSPKEGGYEATWMPIRGEHLEDRNMAYRFELANLTKTGTYRKVGELVGNLATANGVDLAATFKELRVQYVLVPNESNSQTLELGSALDSVPELESAGVTEFGRLWRVKGSTTLPQVHHSVWSITKAVQVGILGLFFLLSAPTKGRSRIGRDSEIFVDGEDSDV